MLTYISRFWLGGFEPFWPHIVLLSSSVVASLAVGAGIIFERPKYSPSVHRVAFWLVVGGVVIEAICTIFLFVFDEGISGAQQSTIRAQQRKIIALEGQIAPRHIDPDEQEVIAKVLRRFPGIQFDLCITPGIEEGFLKDIENMLALAGWTVRNFGGPNASPEQLVVPQGFDPGIGVCGVTKVQILIDESHKAEFREPAAMLAGALKILGIEASAASMANIPRMRPEIMHIQIGSRL